MHQGGELQQLEVGQAEEDGRRPQGQGVAPAGLDRAQQEAAEEQLLDDRRPDHDQHHQQGHAEPLGPVGEASRPAPTPTTCRPRSTGAGTARGTKTSWTTTPIGRPRMSLMRNRKPVVLPQRAGPEPAAHDDHHPDQADPQRDLEDGDQPEREVDVVGARVAGRPARMMTAPMLEKTKAANQPASAIPIEKRGSSGAGAREASVLARGEAAGSGGGGSAGQPVGHASAPRRSSSASRAGALQRAGVALAQVVAVRLALRARSSIQTPRSRS